MNGSSLPPPYQSIEGHPNVPPNNRSQVFMLLGIGVAILVFVLASVFLVSKSSQKPIKTSSQPPVSHDKLIFAPKVTLPQNFDKSLQNGPFHCPTISSFCQQESVYKESSLSGTLEKDTPLFAVFEGESETLPSFHPISKGVNEEFTIILLTNKERGLQGMYFFKGIGIGKKTVKEGENVGTVNGEPLSFMENNSFVFRLIQIAEKESMLHSFSMKDFIR